MKIKNWCHFYQQSRKWISSIKRVGYCKIHECELDLSQLQYEFSYEYYQLNSNSSYI